MSRNTIGHGSTSASTADHSCPPIAASENPYGKGYGRSRTAEGNSRVFIFQSPLSLVEFLQSSFGSGFGALPQPNVFWDDTSDLSETTSLPRISATSFDVRCHIGAILVDDSVCANTVLTLRQKLAAGRIYEHPGPVLTRARDAVGRAADADFVMRVVALEFLGFTSMENSGLDILLQELIRVNNGLDDKPPYRPIFWNCHDIACRFALLAITPNANLAVLRGLSGTLERAKFPIHRTLITTGSGAYNWLNMFAYEFSRSAMNAGAAGIIGPSAIYAVASPVVIPFGLWVLSGAFTTEVWMYAKISAAISQRVIWEQTLQQRFPRLSQLNNVTREEWEQLLPSRGLLRSVHQWIRSLGAVT